MSALERARKRAEGLTYCAVRFDEQGVKRAVWQAPQARRTIPPHLLTLPTTVRQLCCCYSRSFKPDARFAESRRSEEHTSEIQSLLSTSYAAFCLKKKRHDNHNQPITDALCLYVRLFEYIL